MKKEDTNFFLRNLYVIFLSCFIFLFSFLFGLSVGPSSIDLFEIKKIFLLSTTSNPVIKSIIWDIRLPRVLMSGIVGASLSLGGLVFQTLLRNPLAEPYILGVSGGSAIGAILGILTGLAYFPGITIASFSGSMISVSLLVLLTSNHTLLSKDSLLLTGVMVNAFCSAIIMLLISTTHDFRLHSIMFWLMGDFSLINFESITRLAGISISCFAILFICANWMNILQLGDEIAHSMGLQVKIAKMILFITSSLMISAAVSHCGLIGFVGLVIPHILRLILSTDCRILVLGCIFLGSSYLIICDTIARIIINGLEIPTGVVTAIIGAPIFIYLLLMRD